MKQKTFNQVAALIFGLVAVLHLWRLVGGWEVNMGVLSVPMWVSVAGAVVAGYLGWSAYRLGK